MQQVDENLAPRHAAAGSEEEWRPAHAEERTTSHTGTLSAAHKVHMWASSPAGRLALVVTVAGSQHLVSLNVRRSCRYTHTQTHTLAPALTPYLRSLNGGCECIHCPSSPVGRCWRACLAFRSNQVFASGTVRYIEYPQRGVLGATTTGV